jgi:hypothetical protein
MPLTDAKKIDIEHKFRRISAGNNIDVSAVSSADRRAAAEAMRTQLEASVEAINAALPEPFQSAATSAEKNLLLALVAMDFAGI